MNNVLNKTIDVEGAIKDEVVYGDKGQILKPIAPRSNQELKQIEKMMEEYPNLDYLMCLLLIQATPEQLEKLTKFRSPLCHRFQIYFSLLPKEFHSNLTRQFTHLNFYFVMTGQLRFKLYHPKYHSYLSYQGPQTSLVHHQEKWETKPTLSDQAKYIEIIARPGQVLFIPSRWISSFSCPQPTSLIHLVTTSLIVDFSAFYEKIASSNNS